jgi:hypothetical protein
MSEERGNSTSSEALENRDLIEGWLTDQGYVIKHPEAQDRAWVLDITDHSGLAFTVSQHVTSKDQIVISAGIDVDGEMARRFSAMKENDRNNWLWDLRLRLLSQDFESDGISFPLRRITVFQFIYRDGLSKDVFFQRLFHVRKGIQITVTMIRRRFNFPVPKTDRIH